MSKVTKKQRRIQNPVKHLRWKHRTLLDIWSYFQVIRYEIQGWTIDIFRDEI